MSWVNCRLINICDSRIWHFCFTTRSARHTSAKVNHAGCHIANLFWIRRSERNSLLWRQWVVAGITFTAIITISLRNFDAVIIVQLYIYAKANCIEVMCWGSLLKYFMQTAGTTDVIRKSNRISKLLKTFFTNWFAAFFFISTFTHGHEYPGIFQLWHSCCNIWFNSFWCLSFPNVRTYS